MSDELYRPNQRHAAESVLEHFVSVHELCRYVLLWGQVQCGKTGAFNCVMQMMLARGVVDRVYWLCGSNEVELHNQAVADCEKFNAAAFHSGQIEIIFRQEFPNRYNEGIKPLALNRTLIVIDESHLDQREGQMMSKMLATYGMDLSGTTPEMVENSTYILSVDATPYSEYSALESGSSTMKKVVMLKPGPNYWGPGEFALRRREHFPLVFSNIERLANIIREHCTAVPDEHGTTPKFALFRVSSSLHIAILEIICRMRKYAIRYFTEKNQNITIDELCDAPAVPTVVIIWGRLRAGKVVPKEHIGMVWESCMKPNTDTIIQGLLGRMCGYYDESPKMFVYYAKTHLADEMKRYAMCHYASTHSTPKICPSLATCVLPAKKLRVSDRNGVSVSMCPPVRVGRVEEYAHVDAYVPDNHIALKVALLTFFSRVVSGDIRCAIPGNLTKDQYDEVTALVARITRGVSSVPLTGIIRDESISVRRIGGASQNAYARCVYDALMEGEQVYEDITDCPPLTFLLVVEDVPETTLQRGDLIAVYYTLSKGSIDTQPARSRIGREDGTSIFSKGHIHEAVDEVFAGANPSEAAFIGGLSPSALRNPMEFELSIAELVRTQKRTQHIRIARCVTFLSGGRFVKFSETDGFIYRSKNNNTVKNILTKVGNELGVKFTIKFCRGRRPVGGFNLSSISWE